VTDQRARIEELIASTEAAGRRAAEARPPGWPDSTEEERDRYRATSDEYLRLRGQLWDGPDGELARLRVRQGTAGDVEYALRYLELDLFYFRSGYTRNRVAGHLANHTMTDDQRARARTLVLDCVAGRKHTPPPGIARLARAVQSNALRRALVQELSHYEHARAWRALRVISYVKRPGHDEYTIGLARDLILDHPRLDFPLAMRFWGADWEVELRDLARQHGPRRARAKEILQRVEWRRAAKARRSDL
jgi:hypothetical protein